MTDNEARLLTQVADMIEEADILRRKLEISEKINRNLRCCGNCSRSNCLEDRGNQNDTHSWYCSKWEWDYLRQEDRIIEKPLKR